ncbi:MAG: hypothetical protein OEW18_03215 [Candidatus Aminicenantes bacterium]|nr:hypothetical protein [Candidatus Aminicenantes bacterium]
MRRLGVISLAIAAGITLTAAVAGEEPAEKTIYRGRLFLGSGPTTQGVVNVQITIDHLSTKKELAELLPYMLAGDMHRFFDKAKAFKAGALQYLGASGLRIDFNLAFEKKTERGKRIFLVAENQSADPTSSLKLLSEEQFIRDLFLVVALDLNEKDQGEGNIYQKARVKFSPEGEFELVGYRTTPLLIVNVHRK